MARKRQSKHTRKTAKQQRRIPSKPWVSPPPQQTHPAIKISEAILTLAEPLRAHYREPHRMQAIIAVVVMAWNIALFPDEEHAHVQGMLLEGYVRSTCVFSRKASMSINNKWLYIPAEIA